MLEFSVGLLDVVSFSHECLQDLDPPFLSLYAGTHEGLEILGQRQSGMDARLICDSEGRTQKRAEVSELRRLFILHPSLRMVVSLLSARSRVRPARSASLMRRDGGSGGQRRQNSRL